MAGFFSKASSFLSSQAPHEAPSHGDKANVEEEARKPASSGGYGDLLAGAQGLMDSAKPSADAGESVDKEGQSHKAPSSGGYDELLASAQSFMATAKPSSGVKSDDTEGDTDHKAPSSSGYGDLLASAEKMMGSAKLSGGEGATPAEKEAAAVKTTSSSGESAGYGDLYASAQVLMGAAKGSRDGAAADMGEVAGAAANLIGAGAHYGNLEKTQYGEYAQKAQTYLHDYQASHGKGSPQGLHKPSHEAESDRTAVSKPHEEAPLNASGKVKEKEEEEAGSNPPIKNPITPSED